MDENRDPKRGWPEEREPNYLSEDVTTSKYAESKTDIADEYADSFGLGTVGTIDTARSVAPTLDDYLKTGLFNSDFRFGPPDPSQPIDNDSNPLPFWQLGPAIGGSPEFGGAWAEYVESSNSRSGYAVRLHFPETDDPQNKTWGLHQTVPTTGNNMWGHFVANIGAASGTPATVDYFSAEVYPLDASGSAINDNDFPTWYVSSDNIPWPGWSGYAGRYALGMDYQSRMLGFYPLVYDGGDLTDYRYDKAKYQRVWLGGEWGDVSGFGGYYRDVYDVSLARPQPRWHVIPGVNNNWSTNDFRSLYVPGKGDWTSFSFAAGQYKPINGGVFLGVSARLQSDRSTGNCQIFGYSSSANVTSPICVVNSTNPRQHAATYYLGLWGRLVDYDEGSNERLWMALQSTSWAPTSIDCLAHGITAAVDRPDDSGL